jgi:phospholipid/cholesterol/gamma-HCH transport system substrate-binding protein
MIRETDSRFRHLETKIGVFVALALLGCLAVVIFIGAESDLFKAKYHLRFTVDKGTGFAKGMPIKLSGFRIGRINAISLNRDARVDIFITIDREYETWIRRDSVARLVKEGLVGDAVIEISAGSAAQPQLQDGDTVNFEKSQSIDEQIDEISEKVKPVLLEIRDIISYVNNPDGDIKRSLANIQSLTGDLQGTRKRADRLLDHSTADIDALARQGGEALAHVDRSLSSLDTSLAHLDSVLGQVERDVPQLLQRIDATMKNLEKTSAQLRSAAEQAGPQIPPLLERADDVVRDTGTLVGSVQDMWIFRSNGNDKNALQVVPGDSHE